MNQGWHQVGFIEQVTSALTCVFVGDWPLVLVRTGDTVKAFDAVCPHRGANLARGGRLSGEAIICPFHGYAIALGEHHAARLKTREYRVLCAAGMVFVLFSDELENGFSEVMIGMRSRYSFMSSLEFRIAAAPELVIENAFDQKHFIAVHGIDHDPGLQLEHGERGELQVKGVLVTRTCDWQRRANEESVCQTRFAARVFSPNVCVSEMHIGTTSFAVITGATPGVGQSCDIRISIGCSSEIPAKDRQAIIASLAHYTRLALEQDINIWEHMIDPVAPTFMPADSMVLVFRRWCQQFRATCHQLAAR